MSEINMNKTEGYALSTDGSRVNIPVDTNIVSVELVKPSEKCLFIVRSKNPIEHTQLEQLRDILYAQFDYEIIILNLPPDSDITIVPEEEMAKMGYIRVESLNHSHSSDSEVFTTGCSCSNGGC